MNMYGTTALDPSRLRPVFGERLKENVSLARYTSSRVGGNADVFISTNSADELADTVIYLWDSRTPFLILGGGSNVLVSDAGIRGVVVYNRARRVRFNTRVDPPTVWAESGANLGVVSRQAANRGLAGLEWASGIPGTIGGALVGNAGAHGGDMSGNLLVAEILHQKDPNGARSERPVSPGTHYKRENWSVDRLEYSYRTSILKDKIGTAIVLSAELSLKHSSPQSVKARIDELVAYRRRTQPPGASVGSMFKNPSGDYAGRLIEAAGLKGKKIGQAEISPLHANFFINHGGARAEDIWRLIRLARDTVQKKSGIALELEIQLVGEWDGSQN